MSRREEILGKLRLWARELQRDPFDSLASWALCQAAEEARAAGLELPPDLPEIRPAAVDRALDLMSIGPLLEAGLTVVWRDVLESVRRELPALRWQVVRLQVELECAREELERLREGRP